MGAEAGGSPRRWGRVGVKGDGKFRCATDLPSERERAASHPGAGEPVEEGDRQAAGLSRVDAREYRVQAWPVQLAAGLVEIFMPGGDAHAACIGPALNALPLDLRTDERVTRPRVWETRI
jgi:hypothetical protein